ncbi:MAG: beta-lactamase family protein, partial [Leptospiraceae bacterium]|nr:beta-lactamase family protein [Leptospiraceae bacterium]
MVAIHGECAPRFAALQAAFQKNFAENREVGAALCVFHQGKKVVDIWAGYHDAQKALPWQKDTLVTVFSVTKALASICFLLLAKRKKFDYDRPVSDYWPDFAMRGKKHITCRQLLEHRAGLYAIETPLTLRDFAENYPRVYRALIEQRPLYVPESQQGYAAQAWGCYAAELFRHIAGESIGKFFAREVAKRLGVDAFIGLPAEKDPQVATLYPVSTAERLTALIPDIVFGNTTEGRIARAFLSGDRSIEKAYMNPALGPHGLLVFNEPWLRRLELPWANAVANARGLATIMNTFATKGANPFADHALLRELMRPNPLRYDLVLQKRLGWNLGFLKEELHLFSPHPESFGHSGMGGSLAWVDPKSQLAFAYVCNKMDYRVRPEKTLRLCHALY